MRLPAAALFFLLLTPLALAGGGGAPFSQTSSLPADSPFQPGQRWEVRGSDKTGKPVRLSFVLGTPTHPYQTQWNFPAGRGVLTYDRPSRVVSVTPLAPGTFSVTTTPLMFYLGLLEGDSARGILVSALNTADLEAQLRRVPASADNIVPRTPGELLDLAHRWGLKVGSCTLTRTN